MIILEFCDVPDIPVFIDFGLGWAFLEPFKIGLNMGSLNMGNQGKMGFWESSWGVEHGFFQDPVFGWFLVFGCDSLPYYFLSGVLAVCCYS